MEDLKVILHLLQMEIKNLQFLQNKLVPFAIFANKKHRKMPKTEERGNVTSQKFAKEA